MSAFIIQAITGFVLIIAGWIQKKYPPGKMNLLYGYRTGSAFKSKEIWDFAQKYSSKVILRCGGILILISPVYLIVEQNVLLKIVIAVAVSIIFTILPVYFTERAVKKKFPGNSGSMPNQGGSQTDGF